MLLYLIKLSISLTIVYLFYQLLLRRLTFYTWNRWYLLIYSMVCFVIPFINVFTIIVERPALRESAFINYIPAITQISPRAEVGTAAQPEGINWLQVGVIVIVSGMLFMVVRLLLQYYSLYKMRSKAVLLYDEKVKLYHIDEPVMPFSFGRGIYVNQHQHSEHELKDIIRHEFIHVKQRHSLDILWSELLCILNWYNPFAWLLRHDIRQNLEFIADQQVLQTGLDRKQYQYLLLKVIGVNSFSIATNFNFSSLKRRIAMMNKTQSARVHLIRFLFLLPLLVVVLLAFRNTTQERRQLQKEKQIVTDTVPTADKEHSRWKDVDNLDVIDNRKITIRLKNGKVERYDLQITKEREAFEGKYGSLPEPPSPPPAPLAPIVKDHPELPEAPEKAERPEQPEQPEQPEAPEKAEMPERPDTLPKGEPAETPRVFIAELDRGGKTRIVSRNINAPIAPEPPLAPLAPEKQLLSLQDCLNKKGYCITVANDNGENVVIVKDKNNKIQEAIFLTDWNKDRKKYEEKYGEISHTLLKLTPIIKEGKPLILSPITKEKEAPVSKLNNVIIERKLKAAPQEDFKLFVRDTAGRRVPVTRGQSERVVISYNPMPSAKTAVITKATPAVQAVPKEVLIVKANTDAKAAVEAKPAVAAKVNTVVRIKESARVTVERKPAEPQKPAPTQPDQE